MLTMNNYPVEFLEIFSSINNLFNGNQKNASAQKKWRKFTNSNEIFQ